MTRNNTIHGSLFANASEWPDRVALLWESHRVTWEELSVETRKVAYLMDDSTPGPGVLVGTWGSSAPLHMIALLAAGLAGYTHVPLNPRWSRSFLKSITRNISLVLTDGRLPFPENLGHLPVRTWNLDSPELEIYEGNEPPEDTDPELPVAVDFTRGALHSRPRGCFLTHDMILANAHATSQAMNLEFTDTIAFLFPGWLHPNELIGKSLTTGCKSMVIDFPYPKTVLSALNRNPATWIISGPRVMESLLPFRDRLVDTCRKTRSLMLVGDYPSPHLVSALETTPIHSLHNGWASAETAGVALIGEIDSRTTDKIGFPCPGYEISIRSAADSRDGELLIRGSGVCQSYLDNSPVRGPEGWFDSGDMVRLLKDDSLRLMGRPGEAWIRAGKRVPLRQIESTLERVQGVHEVVAMLGSNGSGSLSITIELDDESISLSKLIRRLQQMFGSQELPDIRIVGSLPRFGDGRTDRSALKKRPDRGLDLESIDRRILKLMNQRATLLHSQTDDSCNTFSHDEAVIMRLLGHNAGPLYDDSVEEIFRSIIDHCRRLQ